MALANPQTCVPVMCISRAPRPADHPSSRGHRVVSYQHHRMGEAGRGNHTHGALRPQLFGLITPLAVCPSLGLTDKSPLAQQCVHSGDQCVVLNALRGCFRHTCAWGRGPGVCIPGLGDTAVYFTDLFAICPPHERTQTWVHFGLLCPPRTMVPAAK